jgi:hypothetical protein
MRQIHKDKDGRSIFVGDVVSYAGESHVIKSFGDPRDENSKHNVILYGNVIATESTVTLID